MAVETKTHHATFAQARAAVMARHPRADHFEERANGRAPFYRITIDPTEELPVNADGWIQVLGGKVLTVVYDADGVVVLKRMHAVTDRWKR